MILDFKLGVIVLLIFQATDINGLNVISGVDHQDKRGNLCDSPYIETAVIIEENLLDCSHTYLDRCKNIRCFKGHGDKCGDFPGASQTQRLHFGKCKEPYFCHKGICKGGKHPHHHHHLTNDNDYHLTSVKRDPEMNFKFPFRPSMSSSVESDMLVYGKDDKDLREEDYDFLGDVIYRFREGRIRDAEQQQQKMKDGEEREK